VLPATAREFVEGEISGDFALSGWLDQPEGIEFDGIVKLGDSGGISLKDSIHVLRALSVVDPYNKYRSVNFSEGSFRLKTGAGRAEFSEVKLSAGELMRMEGGMVVRPQTLQEAQQAAVRVPGLPTLGNGFGDDPHRAEKSAAIQGARRPLASDGNDGVFERIGRANADRSARDDQAEENFRSLRYEGEFRLALPANVFERSAILAAAYPGYSPCEVFRSLVRVDDEAGRGRLSSREEWTLTRLTLPARPRPSRGSCPSSRKFRGSPGSC
jgi:hypothetical protein